MITKYSINLRQFNNGESDTITFPTFDQCMMYGVYKLKEALKNNTSVVQALLLEDGNGRKIVVSPSQEELQVSRTQEEDTLSISPVIKLESCGDGDNKLCF
tara:strand:+ start:73 stop:375 length:303 start_codon:yes stop_codon:yes gene_type:complete